MGSEKDNTPEEKPGKKKGFLDKLADRFRELQQLGGILIRRPREFPSAFLQLIKRFFRTVWDARGGGLYALGFLITFVWLEIVMLIDDIVGFNFDSQSIFQNVIQYIFRFSIDSLGNTIQAFMWPVQVVRMYELWGAVALGLMFAIFPSTLKKPLERWLFKDVGT